jgi:hemerythrin-like domain-containing protein
MAVKAGHGRTAHISRRAKGRQRYVTAQARSVEASRIEEIPENLLRVPIDYIYADHYRQRTMWAMLDELAVDPSGEVASQLSAALLTYLERDLPLHIADEEEDLFPRLKARVLPEDGVANVLALLSEEHVDNGRLAPPLVAALSTLAAGEPLADEKAFARDAALFAGAQRRHQAWENRIVMPVARKRLTRADLAEIGRNMAARRGIAFPE